MARLAAHNTPPGAPRYGYVLDDGHRPVGVVLLISSTWPAGDGVEVRANFSSWYVEPAFRSYASLLISMAIRHKEVTYLNLTPVAHTHPILQAQGYTRYTNGVFVAALALQAFARGPRTRIVPAGAIPQASFAAFERKVLLDHVDYGCVALWIETEARAYPFVFGLRSFKRFPCAQLLYCRDVADCVRFAAPLARHLAQCGRPFLLIDANGPIPGLVGKYFADHTPRYFRGPRRPRLGDLAYTEIAMFGV